MQKKYALFFKFNYEIRTILRLLQPFNYNRHNLSLGSNFKRCMRMQMVHKRVLTRGYLQKKALYFFTL